MLKFEQYLTVSELTKLLKISRPTIYKLIETGEIPGAFKAGEKKAGWRIPVSGLKIWIAKNQPNREEIVFKIDE